MNTKKTALAAASLLAVCAALAFTGCGEPEGGGSPLEMMPAIPQKLLITNKFPVETVCYIDAEHSNPLNAKDYIFTAGADVGETQFFNYVVLGYAYLTLGSGGNPLLVLRPALKTMLEKSLTYIKPLHLKGINVLVQLRSGIYADDAEGEALGLGTMDMATINEFIKQLKVLADQYGIDGFEFYDVGGGKNAYPPASRYLKQYDGVTPLYPETMFHEGGKLENPELSADEIEAKLWIEGGSNLSNLIQRTNELLKETYTWTLVNGSTETTETLAVDRKILVRDAKHGEHLISQIRMEYMPDAYTGADPALVGNLNYIIHTSAYDSGSPYPSLWSEKDELDVGALYMDKYSPFIIDLADRKEAGSNSDPEPDTARWWAKKFLLADPAASQSDSANQNKYGALYFTNLPPVSEVPGVADYLTYFSRVLFGRVTQLSEAPGAGDYR